MGNLLWITDLIYSGKLFSILFVQTLYSTHCLLLHDKLSLIIERNQPQQFDQGCSHLTLHVNVLTLRKKKSSFSSLTHPGQMKEESWETVCALWDSCHFAPGKRISCSRIMLFFTGQGKNNQAETYKVFHTRILFCEDFQTAFCESYVISNVRELLYFRKNNLLKKGNEIKVDWPSFKTNDG